MKKWQKITLGLFISLAIVVIVAVTGLSIYVGWNLTHPARELVSIPTLAREINIEPVSFLSNDDKLLLKGWFLPAQGSNKTIIFVHGYGKNRLQDDVPAIPLAKALNEQGYNILMFDTRGCGESGGDMITIGQFEQRDLLGALAFVKNKGGSGQHIGVLSWSLGASTTLALLEKNPGIEAVVADAPFADLKPYLEQNMPVWTNLPDFPFTSTILALLPPVTGLEPNSVHPVNGVKKATIPIFFIHGGADPKIPDQNSRDMLKVAKHPASSIWVVPGAGHVKSHEKQPAEYVQKVTAFFNEHVGK